jgi:hypothetical protein
MTAEDDPRDLLAALLANASMDDEPTTAEEETSVAEAREEYVRGDFVEADQIKRELG